MRRAARTDANQEAIVKALRSVGASVQSLAALGAGTPDLVVGLRGVNYLLEVKIDEKAKLTPAQVEWHARWKGKAARVWTVDMALRAVGVE